MSDSNRKLFILDEDNTKYFDEYIGTNNKYKIIDKGNEIIKANRVMTNYTRKEIARIFTEKESTLLVKSINKSYSLDISAKYFLQERLDEYLLFNATNDSDFDITLKNKVKNLTEYQTYTLLLLIYEFLKKQKSVKIATQFLCKDER